MNARSPMTAPGALSAPTADVTVRLRLLGTTDLHASLLPYDYYADIGARPYGLARIATLIRAARDEAPNTLLFDNGDALQGTPVGDVTGQSGSGWRGPNPVIAAMNRLNYDAAGLGNHEFNFGLDWLGRTLADATFPFTCANVFTWPGAGPARCYMPPYQLLRRTVTDEAGCGQVLTLGVIGLVPPQINQWDAPHLAGQLQARDMVETARALVPQVRAAGADLVLLLAHTGIDTAEAHPIMENAALPLAAIPGVDAIMAGHSHDIFPRRGGAITAPGTAAGIDHAAGMLNGTPAVMAGAHGSHLGVMDLTVVRRGGRWRVAAHRCDLRSVAEAPARAPVPPDTDLVRGVQAAHDMTLKQMRRPIGYCMQPLHSFLALVRPDPSVAAVNILQRRILSRGLAGTAHEGLPILAATAAFKTGGRGGPQNFCDVQAGPISLRHAADLYPFPNRLCGILVTGAQLRDWLERAAICFAMQTPGTPEAMLRDTDIPGHDFDVILGLSYQIDLSRPPRFDRTGALLNSGARRIRDLRHAGQPLKDADRFVLATNTYRAHGGGGFVDAGQSTVIHTADRPLRDQLADEIARAPLNVPPEQPPGWRFAPMAGNAVLLDTSPELRRDPAALRAIAAQDLGLTPEGFLRLRIPL
ncbi:bifunctional 2',3'-cyclic-nucleotide 2'-phosphodiesterase/3'-nucleotidase [Pelagivirga sediminicola]|uniref:Bifunctional 2',3'-cyclic-nucleotide 2'-phosphodiesterase/3'-nucleotidase n=1 Tax=Pelagivirga sediminicola TaxID=2170575 RepID=A0A2T7G9U6_9RHOB|nr:bifunctional 2',3'-cyclic-nucleotide 2'-phosphodiesterase/3'-nucleotidase [Pelagivirga sediminicola]PVA11158.1 bifunctional 2',3'-cyclic-nucleotide 2'-phosphodiesterase/3'-nucleotidase [Pelagivirga sediminicola]